MRVKKYIEGLSRWVELELEEIKKYPRYSLYQVYKVVGDKRIPLYQETFTRLQLKRIERNNYIIAGGNVISELLDNDNDISVD